MPTLKRMGKIDAKFGFDLPGVSTMSIDTHKFGTAPAFSTHKLVYGFLRIYSKRKQLCWFDVPKRRSPMDVTQQPPDLVFIIDCVS